ncbi:MAG TPA: tetratricopeptide repeat protein [Stellaceae bacterium]|nr:tetratricopeptide repeat protein [Stellaceae bacterium]
MTTDDTSSPSKAELAANLAAGFAKLEMRDAAAAEPLFRHVLDRDRMEPRAWLGLGNSWVLLDRPAHAIEAFRQALALAPGYAEARANLGMALSLTDHIEEAVSLLSALTEDRPESFEAAVNHAVAAKRLGLWREALASFERAYALRPQEQRLVYEMALLRLGLGQYAQGWRDYEMRWIGNGVSVPLIPGIPEWQGESLTGRTILVLPEQGLGDMIQFMRYAKLLKTGGARVLLACVPSLVRLLSRADFLDHVTSDGATLPPFDCQTMLMSLPLRFGTNAGSIPADIPYLSADPEIAAVWGEKLDQKLGDRPGLKVGLVWAGGVHGDDATASAVDKRRSLSLARLAPLFDIPGIRFVSLQFGPAQAEIAEHEGFGIEDHMDDVADFADTAGLVAHLDLVITVDTSVAHLAGAMGKPVWVMSRVDGCWRWLNEGDGSPWYPTMRLFRQTDRHDWDQVVEAVRAALARKARQPKRL